MEKLGEEQWTAVSMRTATLMAFYQLEEENLSDEQKKLATQEQEKIIIHKAMPRTATFLQTEISRCYDHTKTDTPADKQHGECARYDLLVQDHLNHDYAKQQDRIGPYAFGYTLHPKTQTWQRQHPKETETLLQKASDARELMKMNLETLPVALMLRGLVEETKNAIRKQSL